MMLLDNYENTQLMLITDSLSYLPIINRDDVSVAIENMMKDGLNDLFLNHRFSYAFFESLWRHDQTYSSIIGFYNIIL